MFLFDPELGEEGLEVVAAASAAGEAGGVDEPVVGQDRGGIPVLGCGGVEAGDHGFAGDAALDGDGEGVAGVVVEPGEDLGVGAIGEAPVEEV